MKGPIIRSGLFFFMAKLLSIGAFYHPHLAPDILDAANEIDHLAMADPPNPHDPWWPKVQSRFTLLLHDYLGQLSEPLSADELTRARGLLDRYRSPWVAEHLQRIRCTSRSDAHSHESALDYVFPPLYTDDLLVDYACNIRRLSEALGVPVAIEPIPTYLHIDFPQLDEAEFFHRLCQQSGCHLLLDIPHAVLSARSRGRETRSFLLEFPLDRVIEMHVAGLANDPDLGEPWIAPVLPDPDILNLAELVAERTPNLRAVTFDAFSPSLRADILLNGVRLLSERFSDHR